MSNKDPCPAMDQMSDSNSQLPLGMNDMDKTSDEDTSVKQRTEAAIWEAKEEMSLLKQQNLSIISEFYVEQVGHTLVNLQAQLAEEDMLNKTESVYIKSLEEKLTKLTAKSTTCNKLVKSLFHAMSPKPLTERHEKWMQDKNAADNANTIQELMGKVSLECQAVQASLNTLFTERLREDIPIAKSQYKNLLGFWTPKLEDCALIASMRRRGQIKNTAKAKGSLLLAENDIFHNILAEDRNFSLLMEAFYDDFYSDKDSKIPIRKNYGKGKSCSNIDTSRAGHSDSISSLIIGLNQNDLTLGSISLDEDNLQGKNCNSMQTRVSDEVLSFPPRPPAPQPPPLPPRTQRFKHGRKSKSPSRKIINNKVATSRAPNLDIILTRDLPEDVQNAVDNTRPSTSRGPDDRTSQNNEVTGEVLTKDSDKLGLGAQEERFTLRQHKSNGALVGNEGGREERLEGCIENQGQETNECETGEMVARSEEQRSEVEAAVVNQDVEAWQIGESALEVSSDGAEYAGVLASEGEVQMDEGVVAISSEVGEDEVFLGEEEDTLGVDT